ncbi:type II toxin-antitoxin system VapC family toxin [Thermodesulfobacteriota bacterium]
MKILLDTSAYAAFKLNDAEIVETIVRADQILFSPVVLGELMYGFRNGSKFKKNMNELDQFLSHEAVELVSIGKVTSDRYSRITSQLKIQGTPIPTNDIWIAAQTTEHGAELITTDSHFEKIAGLVYRMHYMD